MIKFGKRKENKKKDFIEALIMYAENKLEEAHIMQEDTYVIQYWVGYRDGLNRVLKEVTK